MTPKLMDRLAKLESLKGSGETRPPPRELISAWLRAIAVALGQYPRPQRHGTDAADTLSDGFARGLGYADRGEMEVQIEADEGDWRMRLAQAEAALYERYCADDCPAPGEAAFRVMCGALDEWSSAKASCADWPTSEEGSGLARALAFYGVDTPARPMAGDV